MNSFSYTYKAQLFSTNTFSTNAFSPNVLSTSTAIYSLYCKYKQLLYIHLSKKTNISKMTSDLLGSNREFESNYTRGVGTKCVCTKRVGTK